MIRELVATVFMIPAVVTDLKNRRVPALYLAVIGVIGAVVSLGTGEVRWWSVLAGILVGGVLCLLSRITKGGIGSGDGIMTASLGAWFGLGQTVSALFFALFLAGIAGGICLLLKKGRNFALPFAPFLAAGAALAVLSKVLSGGAG